jgi:hypothetical protein
MKTGYNDYYEANRDRKDWVLRHYG